MLNYLVAVTALGENGQIVSSFIVSMPDDYSIVEDSAHGQFNELIATADSQGVFKRNPILRDIMPMNLEVLSFSLIVDGMQFTTKVKGSDIKETSNTSFMDSFATPSQVKSAEGQDIVTTNPNRRTYFLTLAELQGNQVKQETLNKVHRNFQHKVAVADLSADVESGAKTVDLIKDALSATISYLCFVFGISSEGFLSTLHAWQNNNPVELSKHDPRPLFMIENMIIGDMDNDKIVDYYKEEVSVMLNGLWRTFNEIYNLRK